MFDGFFCYKMQYNHYTEVVNDMVVKRDLFKKQWMDLLQTISKTITNSVYGGNIRRDVNDQNKCVSEN